MNIVVFGASSKLGRKIVAQSLRKGHNVMALVDNVTKFKMWDDNLKLVESKYNCKETIAKAIINQEAVIVALDNVIKSKRTITARTIKYIISSMERNGEKRLLIVSPKIIKKNITVVERFIIRRLFKTRFVNNHRYEKMIKSTKLDWTIINPTRMTNSTKTENYKIAIDLSVNLLSKISRSDVSDFVVKSMKSDRLSGRSVMISY